jgi:hypothetical protein
MADEVGDLTKRDVTSRLRALEWLLLVVDTSVLLETGVLGELLITLVAVRKQTS